MTNRYNTVIYTGVTDDLAKRVGQHKEGLTPGFTKQYGCDKLVYFEGYSEISVAIEREKRIKGGSRLRKIKLIESINPNWRDLYDEVIGNV
jgi:putative endonuclease